MATTGGEKKEKKSKKSLSVGEEALAVKGGVSKHKKEKKSSKKGNSDEPKNSDSQPSQQRKEGKKRKHADDVTQTTKSENCPAKSQVTLEKQQGSHAARPSDASIDSFDLSPVVKAQLRAKGSDISGRALTGSGKTYAFVLPVIEILLREKSKPAPGTATVICLLPTRELANQVHEDFHEIGQAAGIKCTCVCGGMPYGPQEAQLRKGMHVVIGVPGRVQDLINKGSLKMDNLRFRILDECDKMLSMGFSDAVESILASASNTASLQTLMLSATKPPWVKSLEQKYLRGDRTVHIDLIGNQKQKAASSVQHKVLYCHWMYKRSILMDLMRCYTGSGGTIVFVDTKVECAEVAAELAASMPARALHGDMAQNHRDQAINGFKDGQFSVLVATDVASRGLDVSGVELVIQMEPPKDAETYIHRSGRTGRANATGTCITFCSRKHEPRVSMIENQASFKFERIGPPQPRAMAAAAAEATADKVRGVGDSVVPLFQGIAEKLIGESSSAVVAVAKALAHASGLSDMKSRSLLTAEENLTTVLYKAPEQVMNHGQVFNFLRGNFDAALVDTVRTVRVLEDGSGAVFDVPNHSAQSLVEKYSVESDDSSGSQQEAWLSIAEALPKIRDNLDSGRQGGHRGGGYGGGGVEAMGGAVVHAFLAVGRGAVSVAAAEGVAEGR